MLRLFQINFLIRFKLREVRARVGDKIKTENKYRYENNNNPRPQKKTQSLKKLKRERV